MATHFERLMELMPSLATARVLDVGSGKGKFLVDAAKHGATVQGVEYNPAYIVETMKRAQEAGVSVKVTQGAGESLAFGDASFDFVNMSEVIEHVQDPDLVLSEVHRVLTLGGSAYISVPNRFGFIDQHFHLPFVNWLPRSLADTFISLFGRHKDYSNASAGLQRLADMHYMTFSQARSLFSKHGFSTMDIRVERIKRGVPALLRPVAFFVYAIARTMYYDSFHLIARRA